MEELSEMNIFNNCVHNIDNRNIWPIIVFIFQTYYMVKRLTRNITSNVGRINNIERKALTILEILNDMCIDEWLQWTREGLRETSPTVETILKRACNEIKIIQDGIIYVLCRFLRISLAFSAKKVFVFLQQTILHFSFY